MPVSNGLMPWPGEPAGLSLFGTPCNGCGTGASACAWALLFFGLAAGARLTLGAAWVGLSASCASACCGDDAACAAQTKHAVAIQEVKLRRVPVFTTDVLAMLSRERVRTLGETDRSLDV